MNEVLKALIALLFLANTTILNVSLVDSWSNVSFPSSYSTRYSNKITRLAHNENNENENLKDLQTHEEDDDDDRKEPTRVYFDISIANEDIGRLVFNLGPRDTFLLPKHTENLIKLCAEDLKPIDPKCTYVKCSFKHSPQFVETMPQYRWAHVLDGKGRNALGKAGDRITDPEGMRICTHRCYGGVYYGLKYDDTMGEEGVVLTVPLVGAYRGSTSFSIVRVGESPQEWGEKLLLNSAVLGWLESGIDVLHMMARQTRAPPIVMATGKI